MHIRGFLKMAEAFGFRLKTPFTDRVKAGIAYLDKKQPKWRKELDPRLLDLEDENACVIGQVFGSFFDFVEPSIGAKMVSRKGRKWAADHGFNTYDGEYTTYGISVSETYSRLTEEWLFQIKNPKARYIQVL